MKARDIAELFALAALWGASFLCFRIATPAFGPVALVFVRVAGAAVVLLPLLAGTPAMSALRTHWRPIALVGIANSAVPFLLFGVAALAISAGLSSIFNATTPMWTALIAWAWMGQRPTRMRALGLAIGFAGVAWLVFDKAGLKPSEHGVSPMVAVAACIGAAACYGFASNFTQRWCDGVPALALATGSQLSAALLLALPAWWLWPPQAPGPVPWAAAIGLAVACTALAYVLYFRLLAHVGPSNASTVTFLVPVFATSWGALFLDETLGADILGACAVILLGTALTTGVLRLPRARPA